MAVPDNEIVQGPETGADAEPTSPATHTDTGRSASGEDWQTDGRGRKYVPRPDGRGAVFRRGQETVSEAIARASRPDADKKPPRPKKPKTPPSQVKNVDLKEFEKVVAQMLAAPGDIAGAMLQDQWLHMHFHAKAPALARALFNAAEHNPWLRKKLEEMASGGSAAMQTQAIAILVVFGIQYTMPPVLYLTGKQPPAILMPVVGTVPEKPRNPAPTFATESYPMEGSEDAAAEAA